MLSNAEIDGLIADEIVSRFIKKIDNIVELKKVNEMLIEKYKDCEDLILKVEN